MYKCSWCNTTNLPNKIRRAQRNEVADVELVSRFKVESRVKARAITLSNNKMADSFKREGRNEIYEWCKEPEYLYVFEKWDKNGLRKEASQLVT